MNNTITDLVLQKRNTLPKKKLDITEENLVIKNKKIVQPVESTKKKNSKYLTDSESSDESEVEIDV